MEAISRVLSAHPLYGVALGALLMLLVVCVVSALMRTAFALLLLTIGFMAYLQQQGSITNRFVEETGRLREQAAHRLRDSMRGQSEFLKNHFPGGRGAKAVDADDQTAVADPAVPAKR